MTSICQVCEKLPKTHHDTPTIQLIGGVGPAGELCL